MPFGSPIEFYMDRIHRIQDRFLMIENKGIPNETILYNSVKYFLVSGQTSENVILASAGETKLFGIIDDTTVLENISIVNGNLILNSGNIPLQAHWKVFIKGMMIEGDEFNVPKNLILTK